MKEHKMKQNKLIEAATNLVEAICKKEYSIQDVGEVVDTGSIECELTELKLLLENIGDDSEEHN